MFPGILETLLQFIFVTSLSNKHYFYQLWLLVITNLEKRKKSNKFNRLQIEVFFLPNMSPPLPKIPSNLTFARIYAQGVLMGFYSILLWHGFFLITILKTKENVIPCDKDIKLR